MGRSGAELLSATSRRSATLHLIMIREDENGSQITLVESHTSGYEVEQSL